MQNETNPPPELNEMEQAFVHLLERATEDGLEPRVLAEPDGTTYPALVDTDSGEVLALLCMPPRVYNRKAVN